MVPRLQGGTSFVGAGLYYLHDKREEGELVRLTDERVAWTHTLNCVSDDPQLALREMSATARNQQFLKMLAGKGLGGDRADEVVKTISLAWDPEQAPDQATMIAASESYLKHMGWQDHQALLVAHNDTAHPHVHIVLNKVHPETGVILNDWKDHERSQRWALQHEKEEGQIRCTVRAAKYDRGEEGTPTGVPRDVWESWREQATGLDTMQAVHQRLDAAEWDLLKQAQRDERDAYRQETKDQIRAARSAVYQEVREEFRPLWAEFFELKKGTTDRDVIEEARTAIMEAQKAANSERQQEAAKALQEGRQDAYQEMLARHREERGDLRDDQAAGITRYDLLNQRQPAEPVWEERAVSPVPEITAPARLVPEVREGFVSARHEVTTPNREEFRPSAILRDEAGPSHHEASDRAPNKDILTGFAGGFLSLVDRVTDSVSGTAPEQPDRYARLRDDDDAFASMMESNRQQAREDAEREAQLARDRWLDRDRERDRER